MQNFKLMFADFTIKQQILKTLFPTINIKQATIVNYLVQHFKQDKGNQKYLKWQGESKVFYCINYKSLSSALPLLKIGAKRTKELVKGLVDMGVLYMHPDNKLNGKANYCFTEQFSYTNQAQCNEDTKKFRPTLKVRQLNFSYHFPKLSVKHSAIVDYIFEWEAADYKDTRFDLATGEQYFLIHKETLLKCLPLLDVDIKRLNELIADLVKAQIITRYPHNQKERKHFLGLGLKWGEATSNQYGKIYHEIDSKSTPILPTYPKKQQVLPEKTVTNLPEKTVTNNKLRITSINISPTGVDFCQNPPSTLTPVPLESLIENDLPTTFEKSCEIVEVEEVVTPIEETEPEIRYHEKGKDKDKRKFSPPFLHEMLEVFDEWYSKVNHGESYLDQIAKSKKAEQCKHMKRLSWEICEMALEKSGEVLTEKQLKKSLMFLLLMVEELKESSKDYHFENAKPSYLYSHIREIRSHWRIYRKETAATKDYNTTTFVGVYRNYKELFSKEYVEFMSLIHQKHNLKTVPISQPNFTKLWNGESVPQLQNVGADKKLTMFKAALRLLNQGNDDLRDNPRLVFWYRLKNALEFHISNPTK